MLIEVQSNKSIEALRVDIPNAATAHKFGVLAVHDLRSKMKEKGIDFDGEALVFEVCNPHKAREVLEKAPEALPLLPCRISVFKASDGHCRLMTIPPTHLIGELSKPDLLGVAEEVERELVGIMNDSR